ncbi:MAG: hypothetical protein ACKVH8_21790 [Pirellulales bacterium]
MNHVHQALRKESLSERRACRVLDYPLSTQRQAPHVSSDEPRLVKRMIELASEYGRYGSLAILCV